MDDPRSDVARLRQGVVTRSISPENPTGAAGAGGRATEGTGAGAARDLGPGLEGLAEHRDPARTRRSTSPTVDGPGRITHIWLTTHPDHWRTLLLRAYWDGDADARDRGAGRRLLRPGLGPVRAALARRWSRSTRTAGFNCYWPMPFRTAAPA